MITFGKTTGKPNFLFGKLPHYFKENDSYKLSNGEGLLERYLEIFCSEIDNEITPYIDDLPLITNAEELPNLSSSTSEDLITHLSELFGNPPDIGNTNVYAGGPNPELVYYKLIRYIKHILQTKGTVRSLELYLALYGYEISSITEAYSGAQSYDSNPISTYDNSIKYDVGFIFVSDYNLVITDKPGTGTKNPTQAWLDNYLKIAIQNFLSPIWAFLNTITYIV